MTWWGWAWEAGAWPTLVLWGAGLVWFAGCAAVLVRTDLWEHRLPNRWTLRLWAGGLATMGGGAVLGGRWEVVASVLLGGLGYAAAMLALHLLSRGGLGMGDVKLAGGLGSYTGVVGFDAVVAAGVLAVLLGGLTALVMLVLRRATRATALPFGPAMVLGAMGALVLP
ncbi:prepilin peptidase [Micrococcus flavus]|uniref:Leader peptidase (Prepilin peptidase)/N-methyltransferase n=1 Tax=Micrococcus flavus TaxID=384602 RepID=A0A4Y8X304_9MICC|nr:prepilin peptidase [Micrococcus flavus]MBB4883327.1 leader peptidase (prepilin peptidase)/N-methyltransferase [Micrococcus flavus]TFI03680.1 prepilin peptidase [Micrococcus flavus]